MPTSVLFVVALSVLLGLLVIMLGSGDTGTSASTAADDAPSDTETVAGGEPIGFPQVHWNINRGSGAYLTMLDQLRDLAATSADRRVAPSVDTGGTAAATDTAPTRAFADIVISSDNHTPTVHAVVRLGDFHVVRFFSSDTPHDFVLNLTSDIPHDEDATHDDWFLGKAGYDTLTRIANQPLRAVDLSDFSLQDSLRALGLRGTDRTAQARGMLRCIIAITEAARSRPIGDRIAYGMDNGSDVLVTAQQVGLPRD
ncbi:ribosome-inactivating family protein [Streptomyces sp. NPDC007808]|uniref:ribosome-inactivating family protein n=1 Tax=Streptomyces sp. NPDC007808 TaxID=3364779 RepID=UPI0036ABAD9B